jgi:hypothetical protein
MVLLSFIVIPYSLFHQPPTLPLQLATFAAVFERRARFVEFGGNVCHCCRGLTGHNCSAVLFWREPMNLQYSTWKHVSVSNYRYVFTSFDAVDPSPITHHPSPITHHPSPTAKNIFLAISHHRPLTSCKSPGLFILFLLLLQLVVPQSTDMHLAREEESKRQ